MRPPTFLQLHQNRASPHSPAPTSSVLQVYDPLPKDVSHSLVSSPVNPRMPEPNQTAQLRACLREHPTPNRPIWKGPANEPAAALPKYIANEPSNARTKRETKLQACLREASSSHLASVSMLSYDRPTPNLHAKGPKRTNARKLCTSARF